MDNYLFSGDTLLINGTGRPDFQNGSSKDAYNSLFNNILKLPEETLVYPGHDYNGKFSSTIGNEKNSIQDSKLKVLMSMKKLCLISIYLNQK